MCTKILAKFIVDTPRQCILAMTVLSDSSVIVVGKDEDTEVHRLPSLFS